MRLERWKAFPNILPLKYLNIFPIFDQIDSHLFIKKRSENQPHAQIWYESEQ